MIADALGHLFVVDERALRTRPSFGGVMLKAIHLPLRMMVRIGP